MKMKEFFSESERQKDLYDEIETIAYSSSWEYIADELELLDLFLRLEIKKEKETIHEENCFFKSAEAYEENIYESLVKFDDDMLENNFIKLEQHIKKRLNVSKNQGVRLSLPYVSSILNLSFFEEKCIISCIAQEIDREFGKKYAYLQDNLLSENFTIDLALKLFSISQEEKILYRRSFSPEAPLMKFFMENTNSSIDSKVPLIARSLKLSDWVVSYLLDFEILDEELIEVAELYLPSHCEDSEKLLDIEESIIKFMNYFKTDKEDKRKQVFYLYGPDGLGKKSHVKAVCKNQGYSLIIADIRKMLASDKSFFKMLKLLGRHALFEDVALCFENFHVLLNEEAKDNYKCDAIINMIRNYVPVSFVIGRTGWSPIIYDENLQFVQIECEIPNEKERETHWKKFSENYKLNQNIKLGVFTESFRFTPGQIRGALNYGESLAVWNGNINGTITKNELFKACYLQSNRKLNDLAKKIEPIYNWNVIVLPTEQKDQLREICNQMKLRSVVYGDWGFDKRLSLGKGINVLFSGPPGCGKTMAAEVIANDLGLEIYKIDLSQLVSKYIGETEKNLSKIFLEAETSNAILFFDEADSMFGKRSEVKDAHDRYANLETSYLLQKIEEYRGIVILATNLNENMDEAFLRRLNFSVQFPFPEKDFRKLIWQGMFPKGAPLDDNMDYEFMADKFMLSGGSIKNIALNAAFYAAEEGTNIGMQHIMLSAKREYKKLGKTFLKSDFDPYYQMIEVS